MRFSLLLLAFAVIQSSVLFGQQVDETFHSPLPFRPPYSTCLVAQTDGNILVGGNINYYKNTPVNNLIRIRPDGSLDRSFSFAGIQGYYVHDLALATNDEIVVLLRRFTSTKNMVFMEAKIAVLAMDGSILRTSDAVPNVTTVAVQDDGKVLVGGQSEDGKGIVVRYNADLSADQAFNAAVSTDNWVTDIQVAGDKLFLAGLFATVNGVAKHSIVKLNSDGSIDNTFDTDQGTSGYIASLTLLPDGKLLPGGGTNVRLNADGTVDPTFRFFLGNIQNPLPTNEGLYVFSFMELNDVYGIYLVRLDDEGFMDANFEPVLFGMPQGLDDPLVIASGDHLIATGDAAGGNPYQLSRVDRNGAIDPSFTPRISRVGMIYFGDERNDKIIIGGDFVRIDSVNTFGMARLSSDGAVDDSFAAKENFGVVRQMQLFDDETALILTDKNLFKLDNAGNTMPDFHWTYGDELYQLAKFIALDDNKIMVSDYNRMARLNADGTVDDNFLSDAAQMVSTAFDFDMQGDSVILGFTKSTDGGFPFQTIVQRLTPTGSIDTTFKIKTGTSEESMTDDFKAIYMVKVLDNQEILVGGRFETFEGRPISHGLIKLSRDGKIDETFNTNQTQAVGPDQFFGANVEQIGSKIYIRSDESIYVINLDGTVSGWSVPIPFAVESYTGILVNRSDETPINGRPKMEDNYMIAFGNFQKQDNTHLSVLKIKIPQEPATVTGIAETRHESLALEVYPQPTSGMLNIKFDDKTEFKTTIYNSSGLKIMEKSFSGKTDSDVASLDVSQVPPGFYTLNVVSKSGKSGYSKFIRVP
ncbi:MAG TPA: T9SS type A sorting domain-containing protein [Chryseolinea sp.]